MNLNRVCPFRVVIGVCLAALTAVASAPRHAHADLEIRQAIFLNDGQRKRLALLVA